ncbi:unnamed protein product [Prunus armeniaca]|uniref:Uncharacterized protein n=1 Tax=Prunus armeniaca TaxID=36596 RepID=A0A6J5VXQ4_PRUAR|nr:unnamed protein product [Prunus armeniaca]
MNGGGIRILTHDMKHTKCSSLSSTSPLLLQHPTKLSLSRVLPFTTSRVVPLPLLHFSYGKLNSAMR